MYRNKNQCTELVKFKLILAKSLFLGSALTILFILSDPYAKEKERQYEVVNDISKLALLIK